MKTYIVLLLTLISPLVSAQEYTFQYGVDGYTDYGDVNIEINYNDRCLGNVLNAYWGGREPMLKFGVTGIPDGDYHYALQMYVSSVTSSGSFNLYFLKKTNWSDPHADLNPCPPSGLYPTYQYVRYASEAWQVNGARGDDDYGPYIIQKNITAAGPMTISGGDKKISINSETGYLGFIIQASTCNVYFYCRETSGANYTLNPKLILTRIVYSTIPPGLDFSPFLDPKRFLWRRPE